MQIEIKMTVDNFDELASLLDNIRRQGLEPHTALLPIATKKGDDSVGLTNKSSPATDKSESGKGVQTTTDSDKAVKSVITPDVTEFRNLVSTAIAQAKEKGSKVTAKGLFKKYGITGLSQLPQNDYNKFIEDIANWGPENA